jgi:hypothetical protein
MVVQGTLGRGVWGLFTANASVRQVAGQTIFILRTLDVCATAGVLVFFAVRIKTGPCSEFAASRQEIAFSRENRRRMQSVQEGWNEKAS